MNAPHATGLLRPFFLKSTWGERFCVFYPATGGELGRRGAFVYVPPFAEEMNKARRMAALQARSLADHGFDVLQIDLYGCGDSSGELKDAHWDMWKDDVGLAWQWLRDRGCNNIGFWGLRLGALLALDTAIEKKHAIDRLILWQPVYSGEQFLTQFLRIRAASEMMDSAGGKRDVLREMRDTLKNGGTVEVGGYELPATLAASISRLRMDELSAIRCPVHWLEVTSGNEGTLSPAATRVAAAWEKAGVKCDVRVVIGLPFWSTQEIAECPNLLSATSEALVEGAYAL